MDNEKGQTMIELALLLPLLFLILFGAIDYGRLMYTKNSLINAASLAARTAAVTPSLTSQSATNLSDACSEPAKAGKNSLVSIDPSTVTYELKAVDSNGNRVYGTVHPGDQVQVVLSCQNFQMITPFPKLASIVSSSDSGSTPTAVSGEATVRYE